MPINSRCCHWLRSSQLITLTFITWWSLSSHIASSSTSLYRPSIGLSVYPSPFPLPLSFECFGPSFVMSASSRSSYSTLLDLVVLSPFSFLCYRLHIIPPPHLVRGRRRPPFFIFDIRSLLVLFSWKPLLLGRERERERGWNGRRREHLFLRVSFILGQYGSAINGKSLARRRSRNVTDLTSR